MTQYGEFVAGRELFRGAFGSVHAAKRATDKKERFAIKTRTTDPIALADPDAGDPRRPIERFLASAEVQQRVAATPKSHWAPVHAMGDLGDVAYVATDLYPRSIRSLVEGRARIDSRAIFAIASGAARALVEIRGVASRGHGALRPSNVLIDDRKGSWKVRLSDPAPPDSTDTTDDVSRLAGLLFQVATYREWSDLLYPIADSPDWAKLGKGGAAWRRLLDRVLDPSAAPMAPEQFLDEVKAIGPGSGGGSAGLVVGGIAAAVLLAGAGAGVWFASTMFSGEGPDGGGDETVEIDWDLVDRWVSEAERFYFPLDRAVRQRGASPSGEPTAWFAGLVTTLDSVELGDPCELAGLSREARQRCADEALLRNSGQSPSAQVIDEWNTQAATVLQAIDQMRSQFLLNEHVLRAKEIRAEWESRGWVAPAAMLQEELIDPVASPWSSSGNVVGFDDALALLDGRLAEALRVYVDPVEREREAVDGRLDAVVGALGDGVVIGWLRAELADRMRDAGDQSAAADSLQPMVSAFQEFGQRIGRVEGMLEARAALDDAEFERVLSEELERARADARARGEDGVDEINAWRRAIAALSIPPEPAEEDPRPTLLPERIEAARSAVRLAQEDLGRASDQLGADSDGFARSLRGLDGRVRAVAGQLEDRGSQAWNRQTRPAIDDWAFRAQAELETIQREAEGVRRRISVGANVRVDEFIAQQRERASISRSGNAAIDRAWVRGREELIERYGSRDGFGSLVGRLEAFERMLSVGIEGPLAVGVTRPDDAPQGVRMDAARAELDRRVSSAIGRVADAVRWDESAGEPRVAGGVDAVIGRERRALQEWSDSATGLISAFGRFERGFTRLDVDASSPVVPPELRPLADEMFASLEAAGASLSRARDGSASVDDLVSLARGESEPLLVRWTAWQRLVGGGQWPGTIEQLDAARLVQARLRDDVAEQRDANRVEQARAADMLGELDNASRDTWVSVADRVESAEGIARLVGIAGSIDGGLDALTPQTSSLTRFRFDALETWREIGAVDDANAEEARRMLGAMAARYRGELSGRASFDSFVRALEELEGENTGSTGPNLEEVSPRAVGWELSSNSGEVLEFTLDGLRLTFRLVRVPGGGSFYLSTRELSVEEAARAISRGGIDAFVSAGDPLWDSLEQATGSSAEGFRGVRGFDVTRSGRLRARSRWAFTDSRFDDIQVYPADLAGRDNGTMRDGLQPTGGHPIQHLSPLGAIELASRLGCRLPTVSEWRAAQAQAGPTGGENLRDATWLSAWEHARGQSGRVTRVMGLFARGLDSAEDPQERPPATQSSDGTVWFARTDSGGASDGFSHLVGNVAEYVLPDSLAGDPSDVTWQRRNAADWAGLFGSGAVPGLIGGSALSDPEWSLGEARTDYGSARLPRKLRGGITDAGVRLAFSGSAERSLADRVRDIMDGGAPMLSE